MDSLTLADSGNQLFSLLSAAEPQKCNLMSTFGQIIQIIGGIIAFSMLILKWRREETPRHPHVWFFDTSKNVSSQIVGHTVAVIVAYIVDKQAAQSDLSPCSWYFIIFLTDVTVGVFVSYKLHQLFVMKIPSMGRPGDYGQEIDPETGALIRPPRCDRFSRQISIWLFLCVIPARIFCGILVNVLSGVLNFFVRMFAQLFEGHPDVELVFVLVAGPVVINSIQYIVQDMFLAQNAPSKLLENTQPSDANDQNFFPDNTTDHPTNRIDYDVLSSHLSDDPTAYHLEEMKPKGIKRSSSSNESGKPSSQSKPKLKRNASKHADEDLAIDINVISVQNDEEAENAIHYQKDYVSHSPTNLQLIAKTDSKQFINDYDGL